MQLLYVPAVLFGLTLWGGLLTTAPAWAQLDNRAFSNPAPGSLRPLTSGAEAEYADLSTPDSVAGQVRLSLRTLTFFKNNEYFNQIVAGYTLFGTQLNPQLVYYPTKELRLEAGVFLWKDFGNPTLQQVRPTYRATWTHGAHQFVLGNIQPTASHQYIEPLFDFERVLVKPLEEGLQYRYLGKRLFLDVWVDWLRQQYRYSNYQEEIAGGLSSRVRLSRAGSRLEVTVPLQFTAQHYGGQIDTLEKPIQTLFNFASGVVVRLPLGGAAVQAVRFDAYGVLFNDHSSTYQLPFQKGRALYLNGTLETRYADLMLSYWRGHKFYAPLGGSYYQGLSSTVGTPNFTDPQRQLLLVRLLRDFRISDAAALTVRVEPVYDFNARLLDFSFGVYLNFRQDWLLGNARRRAQASP